MSTPAALQYQHIVDVKGPLSPLFAESVSLTLEARKEGSNPLWV